MGSGCSVEAAGDAGDTEPAAGAPVGDAVAVAVADPDVADPAGTDRAEADADIVDPENTEPESIDPAVPARAASALVAAELPAEVHPVALARPIKVISAITPVPATFERVTG